MQAGHGQAEEPLRLPVHGLEPVENGLQGDVDAGHLHYDDREDGAGTFSVALGQEGRQVAGGDDFRDRGCPDVDAFQRSPEQSEDMFHVVDVATSCRSVGHDLVHDGFLGLDVFTDSHDELTCSQCQRHLSGGGERGLPTANNRKYYFYY